MIKIHPLADVQSTHIGEGTTIWQFCVVLKDAIIGRHCNINCQVLIENDVHIGDFVTIKPGVQVWDGVTLADHVFIGPNVTFTNDLVPRSKQYPEAFARTNVAEGASIGANATIIAGNNIGAYAFIGAAAVVTADVPPFHVFYGNPARHKGYVTKSGQLLDLDLKDAQGRSYRLINHEPIIND